MKRKLFFLLAMMLTSISMWAVEFTETYTLTGRSADDWSPLLKNVSGDLRNYEVSVNGTNGHLMVWAGTTGSDGVHYGDNWRDMAFRNVSIGDKIAFTISDATKLSQVTLNSGADKVSYEDEGATRTFTVNEDGISVLNFARAIDNICVTQIKYTYQMPSGFTKVTSADDLTAENFGNNYYVISARENPHLVLAYNTTRGGDGNTDLYYTTENVSNNLYQLWRLEYNDDETGGFSMRNVKKDNLLLQTESYGAYPIRLHDQPNPCQWTRILPASDSNDGFTFRWGAKTGQDDSYFGLWSPGNDYFSGEYLAGNKSDDAQKGHFNIYAIPRAAFNAQYAATHVDITDLMLNPAVANNIGWSGGNVATGQQYIGAPDNTYLDRRNNLMNTSQAITLPAGDYVVKAASRASTSQGDAWLYAYPAGGTDIDRYSINKKDNDGNVLGNGWDWTMMAFTLAEETTMNIGFYMAKSSWASVDDWHLYKVNGSTTPEDVISAFSGKLTYTEDEKQSASVRSDAETAISTLETTWSLDNFKDARTKVTAAETSVKTYANLKAAIDKANYILANNNFVTSAATTTFQGVVTEATTGWNNGTYSDAQANEEITTLGTGVSGLRGNAGGAAGIYMASTWGKTNENWWNAPYINTWSIEGDNDGSGFSVPFFEWYTDDTNNLPLNTTLSGTLSGLENGCYEVQIWARVQRRTDADFGNNNDLTMSVNGGTAVSIMNGDAISGYAANKAMRIGRFTARGMVTDGTLTLSIKTGGSVSNVHWLSWRDVKYTKLDEANMAVNATAQWGTFCAPFDVAIPGGVNAYKCSAVENGVLTLTPVETTISANTPVILNAGSGLESTTFYGVREGSDDIVTYGLLKGNVSTTVQDVPSGAYLLQRNNGKTGFYMANGDGYKIGYNRCYLVESGEFTAREAFLLEGEGETAINEIEAVEAKAEGLKDGKYLINGRIVIVKDGKTLSISGQILK